MSVPFWFRLIHTWCVNGRTGLTLPFVVGADARARNAVARDADVHRILGEIRAFEGPGGTLKLLWCPDRCALVITLNSFGHGGFKVDDSLTKDGVKEEKILAELAQVSAARVRDGQFSRVGNPPDWAPFEPADFEFIDSVIGRRR